MAFEIRYYNANSEQRRYRIRHHEYPCFLGHPVDESMKTCYSALCYQKSISTKAFSQKLTSFRKHSYTLLQHKGNEFCHNLYFLTTILATRFRRPLIFQTINSVRSKSLSMKGVQHQIAKIEGLENLSLWQNFISVQYFFVCFQEKDVQTEKMFSIAKFGLFCHSFLYYGGKR